MEKSYLVGLGFDCKDGHLRMTRGKNFRIYGGSEETHETMQETVIKFNEKLDKKGKTLDAISENEFTDILYSVKSKLPKPGNVPQRKSGQNKKQNKQ